jgi:hypothetical protein
MFSRLFQIAEIVTFLCALVGIWRVSRWPNWQIRAIVYGWGLLFFWSLVWAVVLPNVWRGKMNPRDFTDAFPDGTLALGFLIGGWFYPAVIVGIAALIRHHSKRS